MTGIRWKSERDGEEMMPRDSANVAVAWPAEKRACARRRFSRPGDVYFNGLFIGVGASNRVPTNRSVDALARARPDITI